MAIFIQYLLYSLLLVAPAASLAPQYASSATLRMQQELQNGSVRSLTEQEGYLLILHREALQSGLESKDFALLIRIAHAESNFRQFSKNGEVLKGKKNHKDIGIFQINEKYHLSDAEELGYDIYHPEGNIRFAVHLYKREGARPWYWSKGGWGR